MVFNSNPARLQWAGLISRGVTWCVVCSLSFVMPDPEIGYKEHNRCIPPLLRKTEIWKTDDFIIPYQYHRHIDSYEKLNVVLSEKSTDLPSFST